MSVFKGWSVDALRGAEAVLRLLDSSPRFNKPQREVITDVHAQVTEALKAADEGGER